MRKITALFLTFLLIFALGITASADTGASKLTGFATVSSDGSCQIALTATLRLSEAVDSLHFPIPSDATGVTLNGSRATAAKDGDVRQLNLSRAVRNVVGDVTVSIHYTLKDVIHNTKDGTLELQLPLLCGFAYPVESLEFSVTMPGPVDVLPAFTSGYHQSRIEEHLTYSVDGATVSGSSLTAMKDHETLTMSMAVTAEMFPQSITQTQDYHWSPLLMSICAVLALLYWLLALRSLPPILPRISTEPPEGFTAGHMGAIAAGQGIDLTMTVLSWAQLGYILIQVDRRQQVLLHKRMDMGNERSETERRWFKKLFAKSDRVNTTDTRYAGLCRACAKSTGGMGELLHRRTGNPMVFRTLAAGMGLFGGAGIAVALAQGAALQGLLIALLGLAGAASGWLIQDLGAGILLGQRRKLVMGLSLSCGWLILSLLAGAFSLGLGMVAGLLAAGLLLAWGGRRTPFGRQVRTQVYGLKRYLRTVDKTQLHRICENDPDYFFRLAPYAIALGVDTVFARHFGSQKLERCPYLTCGMDAHMTASQWQKLMASTIRSMNDRANRLPFEQLLATLYRITRT